MGRDGTYHVLAEVDSGILNEGGAAAVAAAVVVSVPVPDGAGSTRSGGIAAGTLRSASSLMARAALARGDRGKNRLPNRLAARSGSEQRQPRPQAFRIPKIKILMKSMCITKLHKHVCPDPSIISSIKVLNLKRTKSGYI
jgi:hypothetical protein